MASSGSAHTLKLSPVLDLNEAVGLHGQLLAMRGRDLVIDASAVQRCGTQCVQVLISAARTWEEDHKSYRITGVSDAFGKTMQLIGVDIDHLLVKEN
ncbi:STAS domain-containing protein [Gellertiella hungarica]|uniref:Chemotaxis protein CheX n=1 Tax=Gellertiella hungarica TaxID=1572859 RepID=A0A7W6NK73_9HYPH|nr:STAS domain-containing protein [Gellertiella hungarica]MBB4064090.1 chemotaxis protein CheX [Gellertiella hungarica]